MWKEIERLRSLFISDWNFMLNYVFVWWQCFEKKMTCKNCNLCSFCLALILQSFSCYMRHQTTVKTSTFVADYSYTILILHIFFVGFWGWGLSGIY